MVSKKTALLQKSVAVKNSEKKKSLFLPETKIKNPAESFTIWIGSIQSLLAHSALFILVFILGFLGVNWEMLMLILTTAVSLEAIYLAIFIQMSINRSAENLQTVAEDLGEIHEGVEDLAEGVEEISGDVDELQKDMGEMQEDVEEINTNVDEIQIDVSDIQGDLDDIQTDVDDLQGDINAIARGDKKGEKRDEAQKELLKNIHKNMARVKSDLEKLRAKNSSPKKEK